MLSICLKKMWRISIQSSAGFKELGRAAVRSEASDAFEGGFQEAFGAGGGSEEMGVRPVWLEYVRIWLKFG